MSNNLSLSQVAAAQNQKEVTINDQAGQLDAALTEVLTIEVDDSNAYVLTADQFRRSFFIVVTEGSPAPTAAIALQAPAIRRGLFKLLNLTGQTVTIEVSGQSETAPQIPAGENRMLSCDGADVRAAGIGTPDLGSASIGDAARCRHLRHRQRAAALLERQRARARHRAVRCRPASAGPQHRRRAAGGDRPGAARGLPGGLQRLDRLREDRRHG